MATFGYARVSTRVQDLAGQIATHEKTPVAYAGPQAVVAVG
jgi:hypothetical protein